MPVRYRTNVCIVIRKKGSRRVLLCHRKGHPHDSGWQFPQGGIDDTADLFFEMKRELKEEIGTDAVAVLAVSRKKYAYKFPADALKSRPGFGGQIQQWVLVELLLDESSIHFNHKPAEFDAFKWATARAALREIVDFKKPTYLKAMTDLGLIKKNHHKVK